MFWSNSSRVILHCLALVGIAMDWLCYEAKERFAGWQIIQVIHIPRWKWEMIKGMEGSVEGHEAVPNETNWIRRNEFGYPDLPMGKYVREEKRKTI